MIGHFFQALIKHLNVENVKFNSSVCSIDDFECMYGLDVKKLTLSLQRLRNRFDKEDVRAIGILLDHDGQFQKRLDIVNASIRNVFDCDLNFTQSGESRDMRVEISPGDSIHLRVSFCLVGVEGQGELETLFAQFSVYSQ